MLLICNDYCVGVLKAKWIFSFLVVLSLIFYPNFCFCCYKINRCLLPCPYFVKMYFLHEQSETECVTDAELTDVKLQLISFILRSLFFRKCGNFVYFPIHILCNVCSASVLPVCINSNHPNGQVLQNETFLVDLTCARHSSWKGSYHWGTWFSRKRVMGTRVNDHSTAPPPPHPPFVLSHPPSRTHPSLFTSTNIYLQYHRRHGV